jgi:pimeloyl-ACP methyl ester carboxylesterase
MMFFLQHGYRVIAHDRRGHGRSSQIGDGHDMDHYADDLAAVTAHLDLHDAVHIGHSTGGGEVVHYIARHGQSRVAKAVLISSVPPLMLQTEANPGGLLKSVFDDLQAQVAAHRSVLYPGLAAGPFYGFNRPGVQPVEAIIENWWRQGMMGGANAHYDGIVAFSQTYFTEDLKQVTVPGHRGRHDQRRPAGLRAILTATTATRLPPYGPGGLHDQLGHLLRVGDQRQVAGIDLDRARAHPAPGRRCTPAPPPPGDHRPA